MTQKVVNYDVAAYPDCMNTGCNVMAVLCQDDNGQYACYVGVVRLPEYDPERPEIYQGGKKYGANQVADRGNKQTEAQARKYFMFPKGCYRE